MNLGKSLSEHIHRIGPREFITGYLQILAGCLLGAHSDELIDG